MTEVILCLDIGGTNCRIGLVDRENRLYGQRMTGTGALAEKGFMEGLAELIRGYAAQYREQFQIRGVSLGFPSTIDRTRRHVLSTPNIPGLNDISVADFLEEKLQIPVFLERDVNLLLLHDLDRFGLLGEKTVIGIYFGTGIGNGIYINGRLLYGRNGVAGELGHIPQLHSHSRCGCGNPNCVEAMGGGKYLEELCEKDFPGTEIKDIYRLHGDTPQIRAQVEAMGATVACEVNILDPDYVILGGGLLQMEDFPVELLEQYIRRHTRKPFPEQNLRLLYSAATQENGVIGAGIYGWRILSQQRFCSGSGSAVPARA